MPGSTTATNTTTFLYAGVAAAATLVIGIASLAYSREKYKYKYTQQKVLNKEYQEAVEEEDPILTRLTDVEVELLSMQMGPIATITWFHGNHKEVASILRERVQGIVDKNPWTAGRILQRNQKEYLSYSSKPPTSATSKMFEHIKEPYGGIHRKTPVVGIVKILTESANVLLKVGGDRTPPLWKVILLPCANNPDTCFAVITTLSHVAGDGFTYYTLHNAVMMDNTSNSNNIPVLVPDRIKTTMQQQEEALGQDEINVWYGLAHTAVMIWGFFLAKMVAPTWLGKQLRLRLETHTFLLDMNEMNRIKADWRAKNQNNNIKTDAAPPFISNNDIVTSWFLQHSQTQIGRMSINFRNRLEGHTHSHAGNYAHTLFYRNPQDTSNPGLIRMSVLNLKRAVTASQPPSNSDFFSCWWGLVHIALIANWVSFADKESVPLIGTISSTQQPQQIIHMPLYDAVSQLPTNLPLCTLFQAWPGQLGVKITGTPDKMANLIKEGSSLLAGSLV